MLAAQAFTAPWNSTTTPKTTPSVNVLAGDVLVGIAIAEDNDGAPNLSLSNSGTPLTWTIQQRVQVAGFSEVAIWAASAVASEPITVAFACGQPYFFGGAALVFRWSAGVGVSGKTNGEGAPLLTLMPRAPRSAIVVVNGDTNAVDGSGRVWRPTEGRRAICSIFSPRPPIPSTSAFTRTYLAAPCATLGSPSRLARNTVSRPLRFVEADVADVAMSAWAWLPPPPPWAQHRRHVTREAGPVCPRCCFREGT